MHRFCPISRVIQVRTATEQFMKLIFETCRGLRNKSPKTLGMLFCIRLRSLEKHYPPTFLLA